MYFHHLLFFPFLCKTRNKIWTWMRCCCCRSWGSTGRWRRPRSRSSRRRCCPARWWRPCCSWRLRGAGEDRSGNVDVVWCMKYYETRNKQTVHFTTTNTRLYLVCIEKRFLFTVVLSVVSTLRQSWYGATTLLNCIVSDSFKHTAYHTNLLPPSRVNPYHL